MNDCQPKENEALSALKRTTDLTRDWNQCDEFEDAWGRMQEDQLK